MKSLLKLGAIGLLWRALTPKPPPPPEPAGPDVDWMDDTERRRFLQRTW